LATLALFISFGGGVQAVIEVDPLPPLPRNSEDRGPTIILENRYGDLGEPQCMATLLDALDMPRRRVVARFEQHPPGHVPVPCQLFARLYARRVTFAPQPTALLGAA